MTTRVSDIIVPAIFTPYVQQLTEVKSRLVQSGILSPDALLDQMLSGAGLTFNVPSFRDLGSDEERTSTDADHYSWETGVAVGSGAGTLDPTPLGTGTSQEVGVRLSRNNSWSSADLAAALAGTDPMNSIASRLAEYWRRRLQAAFIATLSGVNKDNGANDSGDYANDIVGGAFLDGVTNFSAEACLDAALTMGDSQEDLAAMVVHSVVYNRMQKNNLIDFIPDSEGRVSIPTFLGREVIVDDGMPSGTAVVRADGSAGTSGMYETWLFGRGFCRFGRGTPKVATEVERKAGAGNGGGAEVLYNRVEWMLHPTGHAYTGTAPNGGPTNAASSNNLNIAGSWNRVYPERKQIKFARLITREA